MAPSYTFKPDKTFGIDMRNLFSKQLIKYPRILFTSKRVSIGNFPSKNSAAKAIEKGSQLHNQFVFGQTKS